MLYLIFIPLGIYAFFQIAYYIKYKYKKEIIIFSVLFAVSCLYLFFYFKETYISQPTDWITFIYEPLVSILFDHEMTH